MNYTQRILLRSGVGSAHATTGVFVGRSPEAAHSMIDSRNPQQSESVQMALQQLELALHVLSSAADQLAAGTAVSLSRAELRDWLQPQARKAESAMHRLRALGKTRTTAATELTQSLTVLVLAIDILASDDVKEFMAGSDLLQRNAERALSCFQVLRDDLTANEQALG